MRIALVAPLVTTIAQPFVGGSQALVADLAMGLVARGHEVTMFARAGSVVPGVHIEPIAVPAQVLPANFSSTPQTSVPDPAFFVQANIFLELFLQLRHAPFDIVHTHAFDWPAFTFSALVQHIPIIHTIHLPAVSAEINQALRTLHQHGHLLTLVAVSQACARDYEPYTPVDQVIYNGLDLAAIPFAPNTPEQAPLLFAGRIAPEKGVEQAIEIAEQAGYPLLIAGGVYDEDYYTRRIQPRVQQAEGRVSYLGSLTHADLWRLMGQCRGLLFPIAWDEPFGLTAVEAMAAGTPVVAFNRGAAAEVIRHGETGFLTAPGDITQAVVYTHQLPTISRQYCRQHVRANFSLAHMLDEHERLYARLHGRQNA